MHEAISFKPVGIIRTPFKSKAGMPIQPTGVKAAPGEIHIYPEFAAGIRDLEGFSHIILLYYFHKVKTAKLTVIPFLDTSPRGVFATRAPARPNPIGLSIVEIDRVVENVIHIKKIDVLNETPLLDIKPFVPAVDTPNSPVRTGWLEKAAKNFPRKKSDNRF
jgi:tRNA-Thr(GGU) m(6)t(6)A37 methyltransferase TsaA